MISKEIMFYKLNDESPLLIQNVTPHKVYLLSFFIFSEKKEISHSPCLLKINFNHQYISEYARKKNNLSFSNSLGYYKYIKVQPSGEIFRKYFMIPHGIETLMIKCMAWKNNSNIYISKHISFDEITIEEFSQLKQYELISPLFIDFLQHCTKLYHAKRLKKLHRYIHYSEKKYSKNLLEFYKQIFYFYRDKIPKKAESFGIKILEYKPRDKEFRKIFYEFYIEYGSLKKAFLVLDNDSVLSLYGINQKKLQKIVLRLKKETLVSIIDNLFSRFPLSRDSLNQWCFSILKDIDPPFAIEYGKLYIAKYPENIRYAKVLFRRMERIQQYTDIIPLAKKVLFYNSDEDIKSILNRCEIREKIKLYGGLYIVEIDKFNKLIKDFITEFGYNDLYLNLLLFEFFREKSYIEARNYLQKAMKISQDKRLIRKMYDLHLRYGHIRQAVSIIPKEYTLKILETKQRTGKSLLSLLNNGSNISLVSLNNGYVPNKHKIFYLLHNRLPYNSGGYATRTHGLLSNIKKLNWDIHGVSRLGYPEDKISDIRATSLDIIDTIPYHRLKKETIGLGKLSMTDYLQAYAETLLSFAKKEKPAIIHAASNHMNGLVGNSVAKALGIPSIYEVRGLWEITRISREPQWKNTDYYTMMVRLETQAAQEADLVLTLTEALKEEMVKRGVDKKKIYILPNGVDVNRFIPKSKDQELEKKLNLKDYIVIGYIGSIVAYEGLELLVDAVTLLQEYGLDNFKVLIVGDGAVLDSLKEKVNKKSLDDIFIFTGRIAHEEVERYYSLVDITPFPRKGQPVCEMVSPLKPFEAMAMEKAVVSSDVKALAEIVQDGYNGLLFQKDNIIDLAKKLQLLIEDKQLRQKLGKQSREWVKNERDWKILAKKVSEFYNELLKGN